MKELVISRHRPAPGTTTRTIIQVDSKGMITAADSQLSAVLGYNTTELTGQPFNLLPASREDNPLSPDYAAIVRAGHPVTVTLRHQDGFFITARVLVRCATRDFERPLDAQVRRRENTPPAGLLRFAEESANLGVWALDQGNGSIQWTDGLYRLLALPSGTPLTPEQALAYCPGSQQQARIRALARRCLRDGRAFSINVTLITHDQQPCHVTIHGRALKPGKGGARIGGTVVDRTRTQQHMESEQQVRHLLNSVMATTGSQVAAVDTGLNLLCFNQAFSDYYLETLGVRVSVGANLNTLLQGNANACRLAQRLWHRAFEQGSFRVCLPLSRISDNQPLHEVTFQSLRDSRGRIVGAVQSARPLTRHPDQGFTGPARHGAAASGLLNGRELNQWLLHLLGRPRSGHSLIYIDLDHFTALNERAGRGACDRYLAELASTLSLRLRQRDLLADLEGDSFAVLLENCNECEARKVVTDLLEVIREFVFECQGHQLQSTASGGLLMIPRNTTMAPEPLISQARDTCHTAKVAGRDRFHVDVAGGRGNEVRQAGARPNHIRRCLDGDGLILEYQPLRPIAQPARGLHVEILARLRSPGSQKLLAPSAFLGIAERFDLARELDRQVIRRTLDWLARHRQLALNFRYCGFNLSRATILDDTFADFIQTLMASVPLAPECFCFEIAEADATHYPQEVAVLCEALRQTGCRTALDGAGASLESFSLCATMPVDLIKLTPALVRGLHEDPSRMVMMEALQRIARSAGKQTIATNIEDDFALQRARSTGIDFAQGFHLAAPRALEQLARRCTARQTA